MPTLTHCDNVKPYLKPLPQSPPPYPKNQKRTPKRVPPLYLIPLQKVLQITHTHSVGLLPTSLKDALQKSDGNPKIMRLKSQDQKGLAGLSPRRGRPTTTTVAAKLPKGCVVGRTRAGGSGSATRTRRPPKTAEAEILRESTRHEPLEASTSSTFKAPFIKRARGCEGLVCKSGAVSGTADTCRISALCRQGRRSFTKGARYGREGRAVCSKVRRGERGRGGTV